MESDSESVKSGGAKIKKPPQPPSEMRQRILQAAKGLFRAKGYSSVSINDIVTQARVTKPTLYHYFGDKESLFAEVLLDMMRHGRSLFEPQLKPGRALKETLLSLAEGYLNHCPTSLIAMIYDAQNHLSEIHQKNVLDAYHYYLLSPIETMFQKAVLERKVRRDVEPREMALLFLGMLEGLHILGTNKNPRTKTEAQLKASHLVSSLLSGIKT